MRIASFGSTEPDKRTLWRTQSVENLPAAAANKRDADSRHSLNATSACIRVSFAALAIPSKIEEAGCATPCDVPEKRLH